MIGIATVPNTINTWLYMHYYLNAPMAKYSLVYASMQMPMYYIQGYGIHFSYMRIDIKGNSQLYIFRESYVTLFLCLGKIGVLVLFFPQCLLSLEIQFDHPHYVKLQHVIIILVWVRSEYLSGLLNCLLLISNIDLCNTDT